LEHCKGGCSYAVKLNDNEVLSTTDCTEERCEVNISNSNLKSKLSAGNNTFEIYSDDEDFSKCTREFAVTGAGNSSSSTESSSSSAGVELSCPATPIAITGQDPSSLIIVDATSIQGCGQNQESCRYSVEGYVDPQDSPHISFGDASGKGTQTYKLKVTHKTTNASIPCDFTVSFIEIQSSSSIASSSATATSSSALGSSSAVASTTITLAYQGDPYIFVSGTTYNVICPQGALICTAPKRGTKLYVDGELKFTSLEWQEGKYNSATDPGYQQAASCSSISEAILTIVGGEMKCQNNW